MFDMSCWKLILTIVTYLVAYAIDPLILTVIYIKFLQPRYKSKVFNISICFFGTYIFMIAKQLVFFFADINPGLIFILIVFTYLLIISLAFFKASLKKKLLVIIVYYVFCFIVDGVFSIIFVMLNIPSSQIMKFGLIGAILTLMTRMVDILACLSLKKLYELIKQKGAKPYMIIVYIVLFAISCMTLCYYQGIEVGKGMLIIYVIQTIIIIISFVYVDLILRNVIKREQEAQKRAEMSESKIAFLNYSKEVYEELKAIRHDMRRHYNLLLELNRRKDYGAAEKYLLELCSQFGSTEDLYICDNLVLAVALSEAQRKAKQEQIDFRKSVTVNTFPFADIEFNSIITNILDNAFEAVQKITKGERYIKLEIRKINEQEIMIYCINTYKPEAYESSPFLSTVKWDKDNHGFGTKIVRKIVKQYKGNVVYWKDNQKFYVKIIVRGNEEDEDSDM